MIYRPLKLVKCDLTIFMTQRISASNTAWLEKNVFPWAPEPFSVGCSLLVLGTWLSLSISWLVGPLLPSPVFVVKKSVILLSLFSCPANLVWVCPFEWLLREATPILLMSNDLRQTCNKPCGHLLLVPLQSSPCIESHLSNVTWICRVSLSLTPVMHHTFEIMSLTNEPKRENIRLVPLWFLSTATPLVSLA